MLSRGRRNRITILGCRQAKRPETQSKLSDACTDIFNHLLVKSEEPGSRVNPLSR